MTQPDSVSTLQSQVCLATALPVLPVYMQALSGAPSIAICHHSLNACCRPHHAFASLRLAKQRCKWPLWHQACRTSDGNSPATWCR